MPEIDVDTLYDEQARTWLAGLGGAELEEGRQLLAEVVRDWAQEAGSTPDPDAVLRILREDLDRALAQRDDADRLATLRVHLQTRRAEHLRAETFQLGRAILDGSATDPGAREHGRELLTRTERLSAALGDDPALQPARRALSEAVMDALYAVERKAMSPRLARVAGGPSR